MHVFMRLSSNIDWPRSYNTMKVIWSNILVRKIMSRMRDKIVTEYEIASMYISTTYEDDNTLYVSRVRHEKQYFMRDEKPST